MYNLSPQIHISYLDVTVKANIYNSTNVPSKTEQHILLIPSNCTNMDKLKKKSFLLLTDIVFHSSQNIVYLGDSDLIFPPRRKIVQIVKRRFKGCSSYIVRNIHKILRGWLWLRCTVCTNNEPIAPTSISVPKKGIFKTNCMNLYVNCCKVKKLEFLSTGRNTRKSRVIFQEKYWLR